VCRLNFQSGERNLVLSFMVNVTQVNTEKNKDGHGYFILNNNILWKSKQSGYCNSTEEYFNRLLEQTKGFDNLSILSHVRAASTKLLKITDEDAHPFELGNLVLAHNGTLAAKNSKDEIADKIDSYWFLKVLCDIVGDNLLTPAHIKSAMEKFTGKFAMLIYDKRQEDILFIVRGKAPLFYGTFPKNSNLNFFAINTDDSAMKDSCCTLLLSYYTGSWFPSLNVKSFDAESIYTFNISTFKLNKTDVTIPEEITPVKHVNYRITKSVYTQTSNVESNIFDFVSNVVDKGLSFLEVDFLCNLFYGSSLLYINQQELNRFNGEIIHDIIDVFYSPEKFDIWNKIISSEFVQSSCQNIFDIYSTFNLEFPYMINDKNVLNNVLKDVEEKCPDIIIS